MTTEIFFEPTLFVYEGTSPGQVGWRFKQLFNRVYGPVPVIRHLWIDADSTIEPAAAEWFDPSERAELVGFNADEVLANLEAYPTIKAWWPRDSRLKPGFVRRGANQMRPVGRLALFRMYNDRATGPAAIDKLRAATDALLQIENVDATERMSNGRLRYIVERNSVRVVFVHSTGGGAGSSMTWDMAYLSRYLLRGTNPTLVDVAMLPPVIDKAIKNETQVQKEKIRANTYAWFKEHGYLYANPQWHVTYPEGAPVSLLAQPFDLRFVIDLGNQAGDRLNSEDDIYTMIAQALFLDTGSSIAGAMRGFNANVSVLNEEFRGRPRMYSSLAAASLVYPAERISRYCGASLGQATVTAGLLATPDPGTVAESASALLGRLGLRDADVLTGLLAERRVACDNGPAIRKAAKVEAALGLLDAQEAEDRAQREHQVTLIEAAAAQKLAASRGALGAEATGLARDSGALAAHAILAQIVADAPDNGKAIPDTTLSLKAFKLRLAQQGSSEADLHRAEKEYRDARGRQRALEGGVLKSVRKTMAKGSWQQEFDRARNDCLHWLAEVNQITLQLAAQRAAANLYDQLVARIGELLSELARVAQAAEQAEESLKSAAETYLKPATAQDGIYELALEAVDDAYIRAYFARHSAGIDPAVTYRTITQGLPARSLAELRAWIEHDLVDAAQRQAEGIFAAELENISLLQALADYHGAKAPAIIEAQFDRLVRYCHPFWQYNRDSGIQGHEGKSIIGVEDEHSELIPPRYRENIQFEIKSTGMKHRVDLARVQHGLPAFLLRGMDDYKAYYEAKRKGLDPLHVLPEVALAEEVVPEEKVEARHTFAVAAAFGYVVQIGTWYYFDPKKEHAVSAIHPGRDNRLDQGREKAEDAFVQHDEMVRLAEQLVENEIEGMGNRAAIALLDARIAEHKDVLSKMAIDNDLRRQYEGEIRALQAKQRQLGRLNPVLATA